MRVNMNKTKVMISGGMAVGNAEGCGRGVGNNSAYIFKSDCRRLTTLFTTAARMDFGWVDGQLCAARLAVSRTQRNRHSSQNGT